MKSLSQSARSAWSEWVKPTIVALIIVLSLLIVILAAIAAGGCTTAQAPRPLDPQFYHAATNAIAAVTAVAPYLPAPIQFPVDAVLAAVTAALGAWNLHQQAAIRDLKKNGNGMQAALTASTAATTAATAEMAKRSGP